MQQSFEQSVIQPFTQACYMTDSQILNITNENALAELLAIAGEIDSTKYFSTDEAMSDARFLAAVEETEQLQDLTTTGAVMTSKQTADHNSNGAYISDDTDLFTTPYVNNIQTYVPPPAPRKNVMKRKMDFNAKVKQMVWDDEETQTLVINETPKRTKKITVTADVHIPQTKENVKEKTKKMKNSSADAIVIIEDCEEPKAEVPRDKIKCPAENKPRKKPRTDNKISKVTKRRMPLQSLTNNTHNSENDECLTDKQCLNCVGLRKDLNTLQHNFDNFQRNFINCFFHYFTSFNLMNNVDVDFQQKQDDHKTGTA
ncbi:uncharacterized protein LOC128647502 [Bombina bombina]|uniref:uncharacterized protein LOC128647502 n=1 Tax=Bombina bombina TaxID=8345 RepID=UPI00235A9B9D|nr:uncharacterized protein LOC128647502 [Bombina bombina]